MTIETKYNIGDKVWLIYENKPCFKQICGISIRPAVRISYSPPTGLTPTESTFYRFKMGLTEISKEERDVFHTKEELLKQGRK